SRSRALAKQARPYAGRRNRSPAARRRPCWSPAGNGGGQLSFIDPSSLRLLSPPRAPHAVLARTSQRLLEPRRGLPPGVERSGRRSGYRVVPEKSRAAEAEDRRAIPPGVGCARRRASQLVNRRTPGSDL